MTVAVVHPTHRAIAPRVDLPGSSGRAPRSPQEYPFTVVRVSLTTPSPLLWSCVRQRVSPDESPQTPV